MSRLKPAVLCGGPDGEGGLRGFLRQSCSGWRIFFLKFESSGTGLGAPPSFREHMGLLSEVASIIYCPPLCREIKGSGPRKAQVDLGRLWISSYSPGGLGLSVRI